jgi:shikimate dehydrogenase
VSAITGGTRVAGVLGRPVAHSLSPLIHNAWIDAAGIDSVYVALSPEADRLQRLFDACRGGLVAGFNVTLPFKAAALALADTASDRARRAGAANLVVFRADGRIAADNTDGAGLLAAFVAQAAGFSFRGSTVAVLGGGGAARGAVATLLDAGVAKVRLVNRTQARAEAIAEAMGDRVTASDWASRAAALDGAHALINTTSLGLQGGEPLAIDLDALAKDAVVMDMVYRPHPPPLLAAAGAAGHAAVDGLEMLIGQARPSFEALFGRPPPESVNVRRLALKSMGEGT